MQTDFHFSLPAWVNDVIDTLEGPRLSVEDQMRLAVDLARKNVEERTGGPFGAAVFDLDTGDLVSVGVNVVTRENVSILHAETVALALAQRALGSFDLSLSGARRCVLATSCEPCAMCLGALPWSGIRRLVCGATDADARAVGFDEGEKPRAWKSALEARGIGVVRGVLRVEASNILQTYVRQGGTVYNAGTAPGRGA